MTRQEKYVIRDHLDRDTMRHDLFFRMLELVVEWNQHDHEGNDALADYILEELEKVIKEARP